MTRIKVYKTKLKGCYEVFTIVVHGHSGYDEIGKDIVCASISALTQFFLNVEKAYDRLLEYSISDGYLLIQTIVYDANIKLINTLLEALYDIENQFPNNVLIED